MIYVIRDGELVEKTNGHANNKAPYISRMESYASPIDGKEITSWRQRDRDMRDNNAVDPRDLPRKKVENVRSEPEQPELPFWR